MPGTLPPARLLTSLLHAACLAGLLGAAACQAPPSASGPAPASVGRTATLILRTVLMLPLTDHLAGRGLLQAEPSNAYTRADIDHLVVKLYKLESDGYTETLVGTVDLPEAELDRDITFSGLEAETKYRARTAAYRLPGTDPLDLISAAGAHAYTEIAIGNETAPQIERLEVRFKTVPPLVGADFAGHEAGTDAQGVSLGLSGAEGLELDASGTLYIADSGRYVIRRVTATGTLSSFAGTDGVSGTGDGGFGTGQFMKPAGIAFDNAGNLLVADENAHAIRTVNASGEVTTYAGAAGTAGPTNGPALSGAEFSSPVDVAVAPDGTVYVADKGNFRVRKIVSGSVSDLAGSNTPGHQDGTGSAARFNTILALDVDAAGNVYVADYDSGQVKSWVRRVSPTGEVRTLIGNGANTPSAWGESEVNVGLQKIRDLDVDAAGNVFVSTDLGLFRRDKHGRVRLVSGFRHSDGSGLGFGDAARVAVGRRGALFTLTPAAVAPQRVIKAK